MVLNNERVQNILEFIEKVRVCDITHVARMFFYKNKYSVINARKKLRDLVKDKKLKIIRNDTNMRHIYYIDKKPAQLQHKLILTELYVQLCRVYGKDNIEIEPEWAICNIRPDAFIKIKIGKRLYMFFVEVQISNNPCNVQKYEATYQLQKVFPEGVFPVVLFITDQKEVIRSSNFETKVLNTRLEGIERLI
jgi:hypothetical protein